MPAARFAFSDRSLTRVVEPGEVRVWAAAHAEASVPAPGVAGATGGAISNGRPQEQRRLPGAATSARSVELIGGVHEVSAADARIVTVSIT